MMRRMARNQFLPRRSRFMQWELTIDGVYLTPEKKIKDGPVTEAVAKDI